MELEQEAIEIAERLMRNGIPTGDAPPLQRLFLDIPIVNYADPLSTNALAASLEVCRNKCDCMSGRVGKAGSGERYEKLAARGQASELRCHPALRVLMCGVDAESPAAHSGARNPDCGGGKTPKA